MDNLVQKVVDHLESLGSEKNRAGMARFGINTTKAFGVSVVELRKYGRQFRHNHELALALWRAGYHEARILAAISDDPAQVTPEQMDEWVSDFDSWDVCDQACCSLFDKTPYAVEKAKEWATRTKEFEKRAGFALMAGTAWHNKTAPDATFLAFLPFIKDASTDERNFVKKAVNWALRQIGKRNAILWDAAVKTALDMALSDSKSARWIASDALREFYKRGQPTT